MHLPAQGKSIIYFLSSLFVALTLLVVAPKIISSTALAQNTSQYNVPNFNPDVPRNQHTFAQSAMIEVLSSVFCLVTGIDPINPAQGCLDIDPQTRKLGLRPPQTDQPQVGGLLGYIPNMFSQVYVPPASGVDYTRQLASNFGIVKPAYAQASNGFEALRPLQSLWTVSRNVAYLLFVLLFIFIGLGIMLRLKIDPRTVMTIQNQIPRIIIAMLLITFSYAIAGLMIDGMWLITYAGINTITQAGPGTNPSTFECNPDTTLQQRAYQNLLTTPLSFGSQVFKQYCTKELSGFLSQNGLLYMTFEVSNSVGSIITDLIQQIFNRGEKPSCGLFNIGGCINLMFSGIIGFIAYIITLLVVFIALILALIRIWWQLLRAYILVILYVITAPLWIILGLLPGKPLGFEKWLRRMFVMLITFPATACLLVTGAVLANLFGSTTNPSSPNTFVPPLVGQPNMQSFGWLLSFAIILITPSLLSILRQNLKAQSEGGNMAAAAAVGGFAAGAAGPKGLGRGIVNRAWHPWDMNTGEAGALRTFVVGKPGDKRFKILNPLVGGMGPKKQS